MRNRDAFGCERADDGFEELAELRFRLRFPPPFCRTQDEYREYMAGYVTEPELRARHERYDEFLSNDDAGAPARVSIVGEEET